MSRTAAQRRYLRFALVSTFVREMPQRTTIMTSKRNAERDSSIDHHGDESTV